MKVFPEKDPSGHVYEIKWDDGDETGTMKNRTQLRIPHCLASSSASDVARSHAPPKGKKNFVVRRLDGTLGWFKEGLGGGGSVYWQNALSCKPEDATPMTRTQAQDLYCADHDDNEYNTVFVVSEITEDGVRFGRVCGPPPLPPSRPPPARSCPPATILVRTLDAPLYVDCSISLGSGGKGEWCGKMWWGARWRRCRCSAEWPTESGARNMDTTC